MPATVTELILIRHGETHFNVQGRIQGQSNSKLTPLGIEQAKTLGSRLTLFKPTAIYTSDLSRAVDTAEILAQPLDLKPVVDARMRETSFGSVEGRSWQEIQEEWGERSLAWYHHEKDARLPDGESREEAIARSMEAMEDMVKEHPGQRVAVVTHGGILSGLFAHILEIPQGIRPKCQILNTSLNIFRHKEGQWGVKTWGDVSHLE